LGYDDTGLALLKHAIECNPNDVDINRFAAQQLSERNMYTDAIACCQRIINAKKVDREASRMIGDLMLRQTMDQMESKKEKNKRDAAERAEAPQVPEEDVYEKKLAKTPDDRDLWLSYADFYFQKKNYRKAEDTFRRALKNFPDDVDFTVRLLELQKLRARDEVVRAKELLAKNPDDAALKERFAKLREAFDEKTLALIKHKLSVNPTATATRYEHGIYLVQHGQFAEAIAELQTAQQDESIRSDCALAIAFCFEKLKKYKLAMTNYETAIRLLGNKVSEPIKRALYGAARLSAVLGDYKTAEQYATRLAGIDFSYKDIAQLLDKITERLQN
ncbi:MAG: tetratricopeptide repeat protein, partial [Thermoguttaceae bacterium]|nr:tetratricopeptide repeat protein [Thermoguttaceae bacterium]